MAGDSYCNCNQKLKSLVVTQGCCPTSPALHGAGVRQRQRERGVCAMAGLPSQLLRQLAGAVKPRRVALAAAVRRAVRQWQNIGDL